MLLNIATDLKLCLCQAATPKRTQRKRQAKTKANKKLGEGEKQVNWVTDIILFLVSDLYLCS